MPSPLHEQLVDLFRLRPPLAADLLSQSLGVELPAWVTARAEDKAFPKTVPERHSDQVVVLRDGDGNPVFGIVIEIQLRRDDRKCMSWPLYLTALRARINTPVALLVVCPDTATASWAATPIALGPRFTMIPHVLGPDAIPVATEASVAAQLPELALLSFLAHGAGNRARTVFDSLLGVVSDFDVDDHRARVYTEIVLAAAKAFKMDLTNLIPEGSEFSEQAESFLKALRRARKTLIEEGRKEGIEEGRKEGIEEGREDGIEEGLARALMAVLAGRGFDVTDAQRERIFACNDTAELDRRLRAAVSAASVEEVLGAAPSGD